MIIHVECPNTIKATNRNTFKAVSLPHLSHLLIRLKYGAGSEDDKEDERAGYSRCGLFLASNFLSHLNPESIAVTPNAGDAVDWDSLGVARPHWTAATSSWTRLKSITFLDCTWLFLVDTPDPSEPFSPSDLPGCDPSIDLVWTFTGRFEGYGSMSESWREDGIHMLLGNIGDNSDISEWPSVRERGVQFNIGDRAEDRLALEEDLKGLSEEWRGWIHY